MTMAGILQLQHLEQFSILHPEQWPRWKQRIDQFRLASGLIAESEERQISMLLYSMGPDAQGVLETTSITAEEKGRFDLSGLSSTLGSNKLVRQVNSTFWLSTLMQQSAATQTRRKRREIFVTVSWLGFTTQLSRRMQLDPLLTLDNASEEVCTPDRGCAREAQETRCG